MRWALVVALVSWAGLLLRAQVAEPPQTGVTVMGVAVSATDGRPLARALISVRMESDLPPLTTVTDSDGRFWLAATQMPRSGRWPLTAMKAGFVTRTVAVAPGAPVLVRLAEGAVMRGRVIDDAGEPAAEMEVSAVRRDGSVVAATTADDRGEYRLAVPTGQGMFLAVSVGKVVEPDAGSTPVPLVGGPPRPTAHYFPGTDVIERALLIQLQPGEQRSAMDFVIPSEMSVRQVLGEMPVSGLSSAVAAAAPSAGAAGVITGRVVEAAARGVANALVVLTNERVTSQTWLTRTDLAGQFQFRQVPPGWFRVTTSKPGYAPARARPTANEDGRAVEVTLRVTPYASIRGRVLNEFGDPAEGARVEVMAMRYVRGRRVATFAASVECITDEHGEYRIHGLEPGVYAVSAELVGEDAPQVGYRPTYFGAGGPADATLITVSRQQVVDGIDIRLSRWPAFRVAGHVIGATGLPGSGIVMLMPTGETATGVIRPVSARLDAEGGFEFGDVPGGDYVIHAYGEHPDSAPGAEFAAVQLAVRNSDIDGLLVTMTAGSSISGEVIFDSASASRPSPGDFGLTVVPADLDMAPSSWPTAGADEQWRFLLTGVSGSRRLVPTRLPDGWVVKEVRAGGAAIDDRPLLFGRDNQSVTDVEVVLTDRPSEVVGRLTDSRGQGVGGVWVAMFSPERDHWYPFSSYVRRIQTRDDGTFVLTGLPPGGYYVAAVAPQPEGDEASWQAPWVLEAATSGATFVTVNEGQRASVSLRR
jgi:hypothetical protein